LATVEGPYGRFTFAGRQPRQIWVSAGIGIAPFVSRLQELAAHPDGNAIDLFHATAERNVEEVRRLRALAHAAHVSLHIWVASEKGRLNAQRIREAVPEWKSADVWFCGPVGFGKELRKELLDAGLPASAFHQELFHLRRRAASSTSAREKRPPGACRGVVPRVRAFPDARLGERATHLAGVRRGDGWIRARVGSSARKHAVAASRLAAHAPSSAARTRC
jgi:ferredoxin-NADP reductase